MLLLLCDCTSNISECFHIVGSACDTRHLASMAVESCFSPAMEYQPRLLLVHLEVVWSPMGHTPEPEPLGDVKEHLSSEVKHQEKLEVSQHC